MGLVLATFVIVVVDIWHDDRRERALCQEDAEWMASAEVDVVELEAYRAERDPYFNHLMACDHCHAPTGRYCQGGTELRRAYHVSYHAAKIIDMPTRGEQVSYYRLLESDIRDDVGATVAERKQAADGVAA